MPRKKRASAKKTKKARKPSSRLDALISQIVLPVFIGIDEVFFGGIQDKPRQGRKYRCTLAGLRPRRFVALLPTRRIAYPQRILGNIPEEEQKKVRVIVMDMWKPFRLLAQRVLPWVLIVVDRFHIVKEANNAWTRSE